MIIRRLPGTTLYWGADLRPDDMEGTADSALVTLAVRDDEADFQVGNYKGVIKRGRVVRFGPVAISLRQTDERGAWYDIQAPRTIRILRDDAKRT